jgi:hypothetical protein
MLKFKVGEHVRVHPGHWLRPQAVGRIIELDKKKGDHRYLIKFRTGFTGGGIQGKSLWLAAWQLRKFHQDNVAKRPAAKHNNQRQ